MECQDIIDTYGTGENHILFTKNEHHIYIYILRNIEIRRLYFGPKICLRKGRPLPIRNQT